MYEQDIINKAIGKLSKQDIADPNLYDAIGSHIQTISLDGASTWYCSLCESAMCGICSQCHGLDLSSEACPYHVEISGACIAWTQAYVLLREAQEDVFCDGDDTGESEAVTGVYMRLQSGRDSTEL